MVYATLVHCAPRYDWDVRVVLHCTSSMTLSGRPCERHHMVPDVQRRRCCSITRTHFSATNRIARIH